MSDDLLVMKVAQAIEEAQCPGREGPYGLYDYSNYDNCTDEPHRVRDFRDPNMPTFGETVFKSGSPLEAQQRYRQLTREHVARAVIELMRSEMVR